MTLYRSSLILLLLSLAGCGSSSGGGSYYYSDNWWYDDYLFYWHHTDPYCCNDDDEFEQLVKRWWHTLDPERQQNIKDNVAGWKDEHGKPDKTALKAEFNKQWQALPESTRQELTAKRDSFQREEHDLSNLSLPNTSLNEAQKLAVKERYQTFEHPKLKDRPAIIRPIKPAAQPSHRPVLSNMPSTRPIGVTVGGRKR